MFVVAVLREDKCMNSVMHFMTSWLDLNDLALLFLPSLQHYHKIGLCEPVVIRLTKLIFRLNNRLH